MAPDAEDPYLLELLAELQATKRALGDVFARRRQEPSRSVQRSSENSQLEAPKGLLLQTPTLLGKMSQFGRQSGGDKGTESEGSVMDVPVRGSPRSPSPSRPSIRDSPSSWYQSPDSDLERATAASSGRICERSYSPAKVFQPDTSASILWKRQVSMKTSELGEAAGCLVSGIYLVSRRGRSMHGSSGREDVEEPEEPTNSTPISTEFHQGQSLGHPSVEFEDGKLEIHGIHRIFAGIDRDGMDERLPPDDGLGETSDVQLEAAVMETNQGLPVPTWHEEDFNEDNGIPPGAFVLETPRKYQIGRPPYMLGRSHVNILAHPDRFRFWFDQRCSLSPLAQSCAPASGYRSLQLHRLFEGSSASRCPPAFMVLTGRWNKRPDTDPTDPTDRDWSTGTPEHDSTKALEDLPAFASTSSRLESFRAPSGVRGVGAFFEERFPSEVAVPVVELKAMIVEEEPVLSCPKRPEPVRKRFCADRCLSYWRRSSWKHVLLFFVGMVLCLGLVACLSFLVMVLFRLGPYRCSHAETPFTPDDCTQRRLRGGAVVLASSETKPVL